MATKDFITYSPNTGNKNATISVTASKNTGAARNTSLNITGKGITKIININQAISLAGVYCSSFSISNNNWSLVGSTPPINQSTTNENFIFKIRRMGSLNSLNCILKFGGLKGITSAKTTMPSGEVNFSGSQIIVSMPDFMDYLYMDIQIRALDINSVIRDLYVEISHEDY